MLNTIFGIYISDKFGAKSDRVTWIESVDASGTSDLTLTDAVNGAAQKNELSTYDYIATKYTTWTANGIVQIEIKPDAESSNQLKTYSLTTKTDAPLIPPKLIQADISLKLTNQVAIHDDVVVILDVLKVPQGKYPQIIDLVNSMAIAPEHIDIQTLAIEKQAIRTNQLLEALIAANGGNIPLPTDDMLTVIKKGVSCKRI